MVENSADSQNEGQRETKNKFTYLQDLHISATLEETFLEGCLSEITWNMSSRAEPIEKTEKKKTRTASCANASLQRVKESRWQQQTGADGRSVRPRRRETSSRQMCEQDNSTKVTKGGDQIFLDTMNTWQNNMKATADNTWQISPLCHLL